MMSVRNLILLSCAVSCGIASAATLDVTLIRTSGAPAVADGKFYGYRTSTQGPGDAAFKDALALAKDEHVPLVTIWSNEDCHYCDDFAEDLNANAKVVSSWLATNRAVCVYFKDKSGDYPPTKGHKPAACYDAYDFVYTTCGSRPVWPLVGFYYEKRDGTVVTWKHGNVSGKSFSWLRRNYGKWCEENGIGDDSEVFFAVGTTPADRLEAVPGVTTNVMVPIRRDVSVKNETFTLRAEFPDGTTVDQPVDFAAGSLVPKEDPVVRLTDGTHATGEVVTLKLLRNGSSVAENAITFVDEPENNPKNPLWFGERDIGDLAAGEWTMDRDLVLAKAQATGGSALTLIGGSLWCPDCVNVDAYLVDLPVFRNWATTSGIYCAAIDVTAFPKNGKTCLLSYEPTTVSDRYVNATVPPQERVQSGAGYLSRKMVPQTGNDGVNALAVTARNLNLATNSVENGGLCRPECLDPANTDTYSWKTGVPCFILQNDAGAIKGRLYQFSNVSPTDDSAAAAYVQRLEELRQLADDPTEELNKHWSTATTSDCELEADGGAAASTISAIDTSDFWRLAGLGNWMNVTFTVKGETGATDELNARLVLWRKEGETAERVSATAGNLATGFTLADREIESVAGVEYFIQLETLADSAAFALEHEGDSTVRYELTATAVADSGTVVFTKSADRVTEADAKKAGGTRRVWAPLARTGGASGETNVTVAIDRDLTTAFPDRYEIVNDTVTWADGEMGVKSVAIDVFDDANADGTQWLVLTVGDSSYTLTIVDNDKANVGKLSFSDAEPAPVKKGTVIAEEGSLVTLEVERINGASGDVGCEVKTTAGVFESAAELFWRSREAGAKPVKLRLPMLADCRAGKTVVSFASLDGITADSSTKSMTVQMVATNAPRFETDGVLLDLVRYCAVSRRIALINLAEGVTAKVAKLSGSVPSGVTVKLVDDVLQIDGTPTAAGAFEAVYQVSQTLNRKTTLGLTVRLAFTVTDVSKLDPSAPGANQSVAKSRTFGDQTVVDAKARRLTGILSNLTIPPTGKCSAKYKCSVGTVSLSAKGWSSHDPKTGELSAMLTVANKGYVLYVRARADGTVLYTLEDPEFEGVALDGQVALVWSADDPATEWLGYYVAAVDAPIAEACSGIVRAAGNPYLTMKMQTATLAKKGSMSYAGVLPDGQAFSGSGTLVREGLDMVILPVYYRTTKEFLTLAPQIKAGAPIKAVESGESILTWWTHAETVTNGSFEVCYARIAGSHYDATADLTETLSPTAKGHDLTAADAIDPIPVTFTSKTLTLDKTSAKDASARLTFTKSTGILSGSFKTVNSAGKAVTANFKGVALLDWGDGCPSCGELTWASGAFWYADTLSYEQGGRTKSLSVKCGDVFYIESN